MEQATTRLIREAVKKSAEDPAYFCRFFLRKWFRRPLAPFQLGILALITRKVAFLDNYPEAHDFLLNEFKYLSDPEDPEAVELPVFIKDAEGRILMVAGLNNDIIMPRGFSKTTLYNAGNLYVLVTDYTTFSVYVSESADHAERQLGNIKRQLERNVILRQAYGDVVPKRSESERWGADEIQLKTGGILLARGRGSQVRGLLYDGRRPNRILLDDVEDKESVATALQRKKVSDWFYSDVVPAGNEMEVAGDDADEDIQPDLQITALGTLLHAESLLATIQKDPTFNTVRFGARIRPGLMLWPDKMSERTYDAKRARYKRMGKLAEFVREYDSQIRLDEDSIFPYKNITIYVPVLFTDLIQRAQACDPAISERPGRDHSAISVGGRHESGALWVLDVWGGLGKKPHEIVEQLFKFQRDYQLHKCGIESQQYQKALVYLMQEEMARRQLFFIVTPIIHANDQTKDDRISGILQPRYWNGYVRHRKPLPLLEDQLMDFPNGKKDYADATAMMMSLLGETAMLATPADLDPALDEYEPLDPLYGSVYNEGQAYIYTPTPDPTGGRYG